MKQKAGETAPALSLGQRIAHLVTVYGKDLLPALLTWGCIASAVYYLDDLSFLEPYWTKMTSQYSEFTLATVFTFIIHETAYFGAFLPWLLLDQIPYFRKYKIQKERPNSGKEMWECFVKLMFNHWVIQAPMILLTHYYLTIMGYSMHAPLPKLSTMLFKCLLCFIVEDFYFYWIHRLLHHKSIYKYVHKIHHTYSAPFGIAAEFAHPIETMFLGVGTILGPALFARHLLELWVWLVVRLLETVEDHSGYELPWNPTNYIPFWAGAVHHDFHHKEFDGNYASVFTIWDRVFGTDVVSDLLHVARLS